MPVIVVDRYRHHSSSAGPGQRQLIGVSAGAGDDRGQTALQVPVTGTGTTVSVLVKANRPVPAVRGVVTIQVSEFFKSSYEG